MSKPKYTMSRAAHAARKAASARAAAVRPAGKSWHTVRVDSATHEAIAAERQGTEGLGTTLRRKYGIQ